MASTKKTVAIITGSVRAVRVGPAVAALVKEIIGPSAAAGAGVELVDVDIASFKLPIYDEVVLPGMVPEHASLSHAHSLAWSAEMKRHAAYVLVTPEYNYGLPGGTKNAIDYLSHEIKGKPIGIVSYGVLGGASSSEQAAKIFGVPLKMQVAPTRPQLAFAAPEGAPPDTYAAAGGVLGDASREAWTKDHGEAIKKMFAEVTALLALTETPAA
ncbi:NADPH-dependent FMN reductase [Lasiosphaeria ovina]|uniref:NADPH-dependent FMN reductase n=1 Tax=Lasiosphaeria ovina TaxID=92902 RepID=A0AAE0NB74_9PEZI|nr:NADPH-dependent FMN reductase [Lasiosphaeria ovina]